MEFKAELEGAIDAARQAGVLLLKQFQSAPTVLAEVGRDIKLQADRDAEALILEKLGVFGYPALAEESGAHGDFERGLGWAIDPLDGTLNFARGIPLNCVSIGLLRDLRPVLGVIYDFHHDELFFGVPGRGAFLCTSRGEHAIHASPGTDPLRAVAAIYPSGKAAEQTCSADFHNALRHFKRMRIPGSAALQLAWVAAGRYEAYGEEDIMLWDVAAGLAIAEAAGAIYTSTASPFHPWARMVRCAANAKLLKLIEGETE